MADLKSEISRRSSVLGSGNTTGGGSVGKATRTLSYDDRSGEEADHCRFILLDCGANSIPRLRCATPRRSAAEPRDLFEFHQDRFGTSFCPRCPLMPSDRR